MTIVDSYRRELVRAGLAAGTISHRTSILRRLERDRGGLLGLTTDDLRGWLDRPLGDRARYTNISHLACFYRWAVAEGHLSADPTLRLTRPKLRQGLPRPVATDDLARAMRMAGGDMRLMLSLAAYCGMRCCEIAALEVTDLHTHREPPLLVVRGKGGKMRVVPAHPDTVTQLAARPMSAVGPVLKRGGGRVPAWWVSHAIAAHLRACGVRGSAHQLRHWYATECYRASGGDLRMVQELLGHASPATTAIYTAWSRDRAAEVVSLLTAA